MKLTHELFQNWKKQNQTMNVQLVMDFTILMKQTMQILKYCIWILISQCISLIDVKIWDIAWCKFRTLELHFMSETWFQLYVPWHQIYNIWLLCKVHIGIKTIYFLKFSFLERSFRMVEFKSNLKKNKIKPWVSNGQI